MTGDGRRAERGVALVLVMFTVALLGVLVAGLLILAETERESANQLVYAAQAEYAADAGALGTGLRRDDYGGLAPGAEAPADSGQLSPTVRYADTLRRLSGSLFLLRATGERRSGTGASLARRRVGRLLRLEGPVLRPTAALTTARELDPGAGAHVSGEDSIPPGWEPICPSPGLPVAANVVDAARVPGATTLLGNRTFTDYFASSELQVQGSVGPLVPDTLGSDGYPSLIAAQGGTALVGGQGAGVLLVDGDLEIGGDLEFRGLIVALGTVRFTGSGGHIVGALIAGDVHGLAETGAIGFSRCALERALHGATSLRPLRERSWLQLD